MKATPDNYKPRAMPTLCQDALEMLREATWPVRCGYIGNELFPDAIHRGSAPFARIAGKVVRKLEAAGLIEYLQDTTGFGGWVVTALGRKSDYR